LNDTGISAGEIGIEPIFSREVNSDAPA